MIEVENTGLAVDKLVGEVAEYLAVAEHFD
jgi:hypothetical protein